MRDTTSETNYLTSFNRELILDLSLQAFYVYNLDHFDDDPNAPRVHDYIPIAKSVKALGNVTVYDEAGIVIVDGAGAIVTIDTLVSSNLPRQPRAERFKYLSTQGTKFTLAEYKDDSFVDWASYSGGAYNFHSYLITGYNISGDFMRKKQTTYLNVLNSITETIYKLDGADVVLANQSSCLVQAQWDWNRSPTQGKWGTQFEAYRLFLPQISNPVSGDAFNYGPSVIETKNKLRGSGKALSVYFQSTPGKDMKLLGWGVLGYKGDTP